MPTDCEFAGNPVRQLNVQVADHGYPRFLTPKPESLTQHRMLVADLT